MARIRTIKPDFWTHEGLSELHESTHLLAAALLNFADHEGFFSANPQLVKAACSPIREPLVSIPESLRRLQTEGFLRLGTGADGRRYGHIVHFTVHQRVSHPTPSKISVITITWDYSTNPPENFGSPPDIFVPDWKGKEGKGNLSCVIDAEAPMTPDTAPDHSPAIHSPATRNAYPPEFESVWAIYPARAGGNSKSAGFKAWQARRAQGASAEALHAGVERYAAFLRRTGKIGTEFVKQMSTFFGPGDHWTDAWAPPATPEAAALRGAEL